MALEVVLLELEQVLPRTVLTEMEGLHCASLISLI